jgi:hypothetical protein
VTKLSQIIGGSKPAWPRPNNSHPFSGRWSNPGVCPPKPRILLRSETFEGAYGNGLVYFATAALTLTGMKANTAKDGRERNLLTDYR